MSESKHTPGPWVASGQSVSAPESQGVSVGWCGHAGASGPDGSYYISREEAEANAALIARAPELLTENEALRKRVEGLEISLGSAAMTFRLAQERAERAEAVEFKLKADLDAALLVCSILGVQHGRAWLSVTAKEACERVRALLAERVVKRG